MTDLGPSLEQLLHGDPPDGWEDVTGLLRAAADVEPGADPPAALLAAMVETAGTPSRGPRRILIAVATGAFAVVAASGTAAATGNLPDPVQAVVHDLASDIGLDLPDADDRRGPATEPGSQDGPGHGRSDEAPGRPANPGRSNDSSSRTGEAPGRSADRGRSEDAPGQQDDPAATLGRSAEVPGQQPDAPVVVEPAPDPEPAKADAPAVEPAAEPAPADPEGGRGRPEDPGQPGPPPSTQGRGRP